MIGVPLFKRSNAGKNSIASARSTMNPDGNSGEPPLFDATVMSGCWYSVEVAVTVEVRSVVVVVVDAEVWVTVWGA